MIGGWPVRSAVQPPDLQSHQLSLLAPVVLDWVPPGAAFGDVVEQPLTAYRTGQTARATFRAANPRNNLRTNLTFLAVELMLTDLPLGATAEAVTGAPATGAAQALWQWWERRRRGRWQLGESSATVSAAADAAVNSPTSPCGPIPGTARQGERDGGGAAAGVAAGEWQVMYDDRDWVTRFHWHRPAKLSPESFATLLWDIPAGTPEATYRLRYFGDAKSLSGAVTAFQGCSAPFKVVAAPPPDGTALPGTGSRRPAAGWHHPADGDEPGARKVIKRD
ncbi:hypothetical protein PLESTF_000742700 [Pleodorina starrii]|nr:hypothetical protein PLESTF_000742700 [Pleodorina starrii]